MRASILTACGVHPVITIDWCPTAFLLPAAARLNLDPSSCVL